MTINPRRTTSGAIFCVLASIQVASAQEAADRGAVLYERHCASCHGADLEGQPGWRSPGPDGALPAPPHDASGHTWHHSDRVLFDYTSLGGEEALRRMGVGGFESDMPAFEGVLSDEDIRDVLVFIKTRWTDEARDYQRERTAEDD